MQAPEKRFSSVPDVVCLFFEQGYSFIGGNDHDGGKRDNRRAGGKTDARFQKSNRLACSAVSLKVAIIKTVRDTMGIQASAKLRFLSD